MSALQAYIRRTATPERRAVLGDFLRFGAVGTSGFVIDTAVVYALRGWLGLYGAGGVSFFVGATANWLLNRVWTFRGRGGGPAHRQWLMFMVTNLLGFVLNRGTYAALVTFSPVCADNPVLAVAAGCLAGLATNFSLSRRLVFR
jgi:putative flippase GtrA